MANQTPIFTLTPVAKTGQVSVANTNRDGTGTVASVLAAGASGTRIDRLTLHATGQTAAGLVTLFTYDGTNYRLFYEITVNAVTASATVAAFSAELVRSDGLPVLALPSGWTLYAAITVAPVSGVVNVTAFGGDY